MENTSDFTPWTHPVVLIASSCRVRCQLSRACGAEATTGRRWTRCWRSRRPWRRAPRGAACSCWRTAACAGSCSPCPSSTAATSCRAFLPWGRNSTYLKKKKSSVYNLSEASVVPQINIFSYDIFLKAGIPTENIRYVTLGLGVSQILTSVLCVSDSRRLFFASSLDYSQKTFLFLFLFSSQGCKLRLWESFLGLFSSDCVWMETFFSVCRTPTPETHNVERIGCIAFKERPSSGHMTLFFCPSWRGILLRCFHERFHSIFKGQRSEDVVCVQIVKPAEDHL